MSLVLAHHGIVDTALFIIPAGLALLGLRWAERKARARSDHETSGGDGVE